ncbi:MAG: Xaa-Pro peptidase family protein [Hadesarchaea archaeon]|nr:Xaa-Pro peptidase family protein [Hadesarchaea archaeon]
MLARVRRLEAELSAKQLDAYVAIRNSRYLSGTSAATAVIISDREPILICTRLELDRAKRESAISDIRAYFPRRVPLRRGERVRFCELWELLGECLQEIGARRIGFDSMSSEVLRKLRSVCEADYVELPDLVMEMRKIKSRQEISHLRRAAKLAVEGMSLAAELIEEGKSELEIAAEVEHVMRRRGSSGTPFETIVASGENSWFPHATATRKRLRNGELVVIDLGAVYKGYASDMTRTFPLAATGKQLKLMEVAKRAQAAAIGCLREGIKAGDVDRTAREVVARAGLEKFYLHGTGHGIGLDVHEPPSLTPGAEEILRCGMVLTVEPGIYVPNVGGARFEDMLLVLEDRCELLTSNGI